MASDVYYKVAHRTQEEIDTFKTRYDRFDEGLIPEIFRKAMGMRVASWEPSTSWGSSHVIYKVVIRDDPQPMLLLRANTGFGKPEDSMVIEKALTDTVTAAGVPTNRIFVADISRTDFPFDYQIQQIVPGTDIESGFHGTKEEYDAMSRTLGEYVGVMSSIRCEKYGLFDVAAAAQGKLVGTKETFSAYVATKLDDDLRYLADHGELAAGNVDRIESIFRESQPLTDQPDSCVVHHDLADHNIAFENGHITGIFDWESAVAGDSVLDLASCPTWKTLYPREELMLAGYVSVTGSKPAHYEEKRNLYRLRTLIWKMMYAIRMNLESEERRKKFIDALAPYGITPT